MAEPAPPPPRLYREPGRAETIKCPRCGAPITRKTYGTAENVACPACGSPSSSAASTSPGAEPFRSRWIFDVELLARYLDGGGEPGGIYELPVDSWRDLAGSKVRPSDFLRAIGELAQIFRRYRWTTRARRAVALLTAPFVRYSGVGAIGTAVHYGILLACVELGQVDAPLAAALGAAFGAAVNYWLNYHFTFVSRRRHRETLARFVAVAALGVGLNWLIVRALTGLGAHYLLAQVAATAAVLALGYLLNRRWTFGADERP